jgi:hypothetical protein
VRTVHSGADEIEDQDLAGSTLATFVPGPGGVLLEMQRGGQSYACHADDLGSIVLVTDNLAQCAERRRYGDFGETTYYDCSGFPVSSSLTGTPYAYRGWRDELSAWDTVYSDGWRIYAPRYGRWLQADPRGSWGLGQHLGNALTVAANNAVTPGRQDAADPRPSVATVDVRGTSAGGPPHSFFDVFVSLPELALGPPPRPPCEGPCQGVGPVRESAPVNEGSWQRVKDEAQAKACQMAAADENQVRAAANDACRASAQHTSCNCEGNFVGVHGSRKETWSPKKARHGKGWGTTPMVYYSCQLRYVGNCVMGQ